MWTPIVWNAANFKVAPTDVDATWEVPTWGNHFYAFKMLTDDTIMIAWRFEATQITGIPRELRLSFPPNVETDVIGGQQWASMFYNDNWQPGGPSRLEHGIAHTADMDEGQRYITLMRQPGTDDILSPRWTSTAQIKRPGVGYLGGTYLFGSIVTAVRTF